ncbi:lysine-specific demethylase 4A [Platysternon megacephalum]|uniref:Lysine-specific demethylase 4A n=1 Tax=Platysternon megacephalum TaxID=55544 RepID=A0A4D9E405_9SAUR|nr:lysine-specific demethylase 4A [Platysternon megacephalum]
MGGGAGEKGRSASPWPRLTVLQPPPAFRLHTGKGGGTLEQGNRKHLPARDYPPTATYRQPARSARGRSLLGAAAAGGQCPRRDPGTPDALPRPGYVLGGLPLSSPPGRGLSYAVALGLWTGILASTWGLQRPGAGIPKATVPGCAERLGSLPPGPAAREGALQQPKARVAQAASLTIALQSPPGPELVPQSLPGSLIFPRPLPHLTQALPPAAAAGVGTVCGEYPGNCFQYTAHAERTRWTEEVTFKL